MKQCRVPGDDCRQEFWGLSIRLLADACIFYMVSGPTWKLLHSTFGTLRIIFKYFYCCVANEDSAAPADLSYCP